MFVWWIRVQVYASLNMCGDTGSRAVVVPLEVFVVSFARKEVLLATVGTAATLCCSRRTDVMRRHSTTVRVWMHSYK